MATAISVPIAGHWHHDRRLRRPLVALPNRTCFFLPLSAPAPRSSSYCPLSSSLQNPVQTGRFLTDAELEQINLLENYNYHRELDSGFLWVRTMRKDEMEMTASLLAESFAESMAIATGYVKLVEFMVKNYLSERSETTPHNATLLGVYRKTGEPDFELAGTVELTFSRKGANAKPPTPIPPPDSPYICNMAVRKPIRRKGVGWHLLKAGEELISKVSASREVYLHCRMIDEGPLNMYRKAGYMIVETDSLFTLLTLQRRRHLMRKELEFVSETDSYDM